MAENLSVAHVVLALDVGGLERNVINQVREGHRFGQTVAVVCLERPGAMAPQVEALGAPVVSLSKRPGLRPSASVGLYRVFRRLCPDVVHTHQLATLLYAGPAARAAGVPLVVHTEHGREDYAGRRRTRWLGRVAGLGAARFFCLTEDMASHVAAHRIVPERKLRVIRNGIDLARFQAPCGDREGLRRSLDIPGDSLVVGTVGRLTEVKRQDVLIRAFAAVARSRPDAHLVVVGGGPLMAELRGLADLLGVGPRVHLVGFQAATERYLGAFDVFALTSRSEGMPQSVLEASVAGLPVVASRVGGLPEVIEEGRTGLLVAPGDVAELTAALLRVAGDPDFAAGLGRAGRRRVEALFDVGRMAGEYHAQFLELLGPGRCWSAPAAAAGASPAAAPHRV
jgi:sugar transferase (PEP-CTERM/EpsH1 system associated)